jgi:hypothetical protein
MVAKLAVSTALVIEIDLSDSSKVFSGGKDDK